ncbi:GTP-binding protein LepA [Kribbella sp. ALI-6-A]|nr:GTP-binding protein LepA [Kribbella sp. ALI-6-A]
MRKAGKLDDRLSEHVERLADEHPPIDLGSVDYSMNRPGLIARRFGPVLSYMARVELEVERNVLELATLLPDPPEVDRHFYADVWMPQETRHGEILDRLQAMLGIDPMKADLTSVSIRLRLLGALGRFGPVQDVSRMLYYLTGMATERSAVIAYGQLHNGLLELDERAIAETVVAPIRRQEPGHFAFYQLSSRGLWGQLGGWQKWLVRTLRRLTFTPVGVEHKRQRADFGRVMDALGISTKDSDVVRHAQQIARVEHELLWASRKGLRVPTYVVDALRQAVEAAKAEADIVAIGLPGRQLSPEA